MKRTILLAIFSLFIAINAFGQAKTISRDEYYKAYREASKKFRDTPVRRETSKAEHYKDGKLNGTTEIITENINPDKWRFVVIETSEKGKSKSDLLKISGKYYCRKNDGEWQNSMSGCNAGWVTGLSNIVSSEFSVEAVTENGKPVKYYREYTLYKNKDSSGKEVLWYKESKFWVSADGKFLRAETESGLKDTNEIRNKSVTNYEYNPKNIEIEIPIKP
jgi:hypothetical protein